MENQIFEGSKSLAPRFQKVGMARYSGLNMNGPQKPTYFNLKVWSSGTNATCEGLGGTLLEEMCNSWALRFQKSKPGLVSLFCCL